MLAGFVTPVAERSQVAEARRRATTLGQQVGLDELARGRLALIVSEAATNLIKHGGGGEIVLQPLIDPNHEPNGIEMLALDRGPGMADVVNCMRDGFSTAGSPGTGLGAMQRQSDWFDIYSQPNQGTAVAARLWVQPAARTAWRNESISLGVVNLPKPGEEVSGDAWALRQHADGITLMLADGLGHGPQAALAANTAIGEFVAGAERNPVEWIKTGHVALRSTRGAALAVVDINSLNRKVTYCGVGNTVGVILGANSSQQMLSHNGTAGHELVRLQEFIYPWPEAGMLLMYSDGLVSQVKLGGYAGLVDHHPSLIAGVLYRDFSRRRDDATVIVLSIRPQAS